MPERGNFVVITGPDGCGKSTVIESLKKLYGPKKGILFTREPGGTKLAEVIRNEILSKHAKNFRPISQLLHFFCARANLLELEVGPALQSGRHVVSDRFDESTYAYQIVASGSPNLMSAFLEIRDIYVAEGLMPRHYIYIHVPAEVGMERRRAARGESNHFDERGYRFHQLVTGGLMEFFHRTGSEYSVVSGVMSPQAVLGDCLKCLKPYLGEPVSQTGV